MLCSIIHVVFSLVHLLRDLSFRSLDSSGIIRTLVSEPFPPLRNNTSLSHKFWYPNNPINDCHTPFPPPPALELPCLAAFRDDERADPPQAEARPNVGPPCRWPAYAAVSIQEGVGRFLHNPKPTETFSKFWWFLIHTYFLK